LENAILSLGRRQIALTPNEQYRIGGAIFSVLDSNAVDRGFEPRSGQTKNYKVPFVASPLCMQH